MFNLGTKHIKYFKYVIKIRPLTFLLSCDLKNHRPSTTFLLVKKILNAHLPFYIPHRLIQVLVFCRVKIDKTQVRYKRSTTHLSFLLNHISSLSAWTSTSTFLFIFSGFFLSSKHHPHILMTFPQFLVLSLLTVSFASSASGAVTLQQDEGNTYFNFYGWFDQFWYLV